MGYSKFKKLKTVTKQFNLDALDIYFFESVTLVPASDWLKETLRKSKIAPLGNEKSKSERVISPVLIEIAETFADSVTMFSGENIDIRPNDNLSGEMDFCFVLYPNRSILDTPIIALAESKNEDMEWGRAQCTAQMYGAKLYNEAEGKDIPIIYGCATNGVEWQFLRLENNIIYTDRNIYTQLEEVLGVWHKVIKLYL